MPNNGYFDTKRDNELIAAGSHFWCQGCLVARPLDDQSPDPRYCLGCCEFLLKEAELLFPKQGRPGWVPRAAKVSKVGAGVYPTTPGIMSSPKTHYSANGKADIIIPRVEGSHEKRGPKHKPLPEAKIIQWAKDGMNSQAIATRLSGEGVAVSYKTIQRVLIGQRVLI